MIHGLPLSTAVVKLNAANKTVIQVPAERPFEHIQDPGMHRIDAVALFELGYPGVPALRTAGFAAEMMLKPPRCKLPLSTCDALVSGQEKDPFRKRAVDPPQLCGPAVRTLRRHAEFIYNPDHAA